MCTFAICITFFREVSVWVLWHFFNQVIIVFLVVVEWSEFLLNATSETVVVCSACYNNLL
jgi:hypothetical protein